MPSLEIEIQIKTVARDCSVTKVRRAARKILSALKQKDVSLSLLLVSDRQIRVLNRRYLNHDSPTDVIAFSQLEGVRPRPSKKGRVMLGDIVVSVDTARREAKVYGHSFFDELSLYLCHGILHLLGWDDTTKKEALRMEAKQAQILRKLGGG